VEPLANRTKFLTSIRWLTVQIAFSQAKLTDASNKLLATTKMGEAVACELPCEEQPPVDEDPNPPEDEEPQT
jgi:hypothetical protein